MNDLVHDAHFIIDGLTTEIQTFRVYYPKCPTCTLSLQT